MMMKPPFPPNFPPSNPPGINNPQAIDFNDLAHYDTRIKQYIDEHDASIKENVYTKSEIDVMLQGCATTEELEGVKEKVTDLSIKLSSQQILIDSVKEDNIRHEELIHEQGKTLTTVSDLVSRVEERVKCVSEKVDTVEVQTAQDIASFKEEVAAVYSTITDTEDKFIRAQEYTDKEVDALRAELLGLDVSDAYNSFREIQDHLKSQDAEVSDLESRLEVVESKDCVTNNELKDILDDYAKTVEVQTNIQDINARLTELEITDATHTSEISALEDDLSKAEANIERNRVDILDLTKSIGEVTSGASERYATKEALASTQDYISTEVKNIKDSLVRVVQKAEEVDAVKETVATLSSEVEHCNYELTRVETRVQNIDQALDNTNNELAEVKTQLAEFNVVNTELQNVKSKLEKHEENIVANHNSIDDLQQTVATAVSEISHNTDDISSLEKRIDTQDDSIYQNHLDIDQIKDTYATRAYVDAALKDVSSLNNVLFNEGETVGVTLGGFTKGDIISGLTIKQILTKLFQIGNVTPDEPEQPNTLVAQIVNEELGMYQVNQEGTVISIPYEYKTFDAAAHATAPETDYFYQLLDSTGTIVESGYQHVSDENDSMYYVIALPNGVNFGENVSVKVWDTTSESWADVTDTLEMSSDLQFIEHSLAEAEISMPTIPEGYTLWIDSSLNTCTGSDYRFIIK